MASSFDVNRDLGVAKVDWSKVHLDATKHPQKYPSEEENPFPKPTIVKITEREAEDILANMPAEEREFLETESKKIHEAFEKARPAEPVLETPIGPVAKFNPLTKAWELDGQ